MPVESIETIWVNFGSAAAVVGATLGATAVGALIARNAIENLITLVKVGINMQDPVDYGAEQSTVVPGQQESGKRTRLRPEDVPEQKQQPVQRVDKQ